MCNPKTGILFISNYFDYNSQKFTLRVLSSYQCCCKHWILCYTFQSFFSKVALSETITSFFFPPGIALRGTVRSVQMLNTSHAVLEVQSTCVPCSLFSLQCLCKLQLESRGLTNTAFWALKLDKKSM